MEQTLSTESTNTSMNSESGSLQNEMIGDFFDYDDGLGAVVDQNGDPFTKQDGKYYSSIDEYKNSINPQQKPLQNQFIQTNVNTKPAVQAKQAPVQLSSFDSFYKKDNGFDVASLLSEAPKFNEFSYQRQSNPLSEESQNGLQQQPQQIVDPKIADANSLKEYRESLESSALRPIDLP